MKQCPNCNENMWSANKGSLMICLNPDCIIDDDCVKPKEKASAVGSIRDLRNARSDRNAAKTK